MKQTNVIFKVICLELLHKIVLLLTGDSERTILDLIIHPICDVTTRMVFNLQYVDFFLLIVRKEELVLNKQTFLKIL